MTDREMLELLLQKISTMEQNMATKDELAKVRQEMVTKSDIEENTRILRALEHASQVNAAEMEGLKLATASRETLERVEKIMDHMSTDISFLVRKAAQHDDDIRELRRAK